MPKVTDEMVERLCHELARNDWLPEGWDAEHDGRCPECGKTYYSEGDGGESVRSEVRHFLKVALRSPDA